MASEDEILKLREMVNETDDCGGWDDDKLSAIIDGTDSMNLAASKVWFLKAGQFSALVDVSESGSSRKLSDLGKNAITMGKLYADADAATEAPVVDVPIVQRIRRTVA